jgi:hypothetical protein
MKELIILWMLVTSSSCFATQKFLLASMHGKTMSVSYEVLNTGDHILFAKKAIGRNKNKLEFKETQMVQLNISKGEELSAYKSFRCFDHNKRYTYAVIKTKTSKQHDAFPPSRAWYVDKK